MATLNVSISKELREFVDTRVRAGEYANASELVRELLRREMEAVDELLLEGLDSGESTPLDMARVRARARARLDGRKSAD